VSHLDAVVADGEKQDLVVHLAANYSEELSRDLDHFYHGLLVCPAGHSAGEQKQ